MEGSRHGHYEDDLALQCAGIAAPSFELDAKDSNPVSRTRYID